MYIPHTTPPKNTGFTLVEVLVAMLLLAGGLLGLAGLQASSLSSNLSAYYRTQASELAYDLADRIRANRAGILNYTAILPSAAPENPACLTSSGCTSAQMANHDLFEWNRTLVATLPSGTGTVNVVNGVFTITITWDDDRDGDNNNNPIFNTSFRL